MVFTSAGVEDGIEVDVDEVVEVLRVHRCDGVAGPIGVRKGVEEGLKRSFKKIDKGLLKLHVQVVSENIMELK